MKKRARFLVKGRVHGVCYRMATVDEAQGLGLTGWVKNLPDGSVEIVAEGDETGLSKLLDWCRNGPPLAMVSTVDAGYSDATDEFDDFSIAYKGWM